VNLRFEFLTVLRRQTGLQSLDIELPDRSAGTAGAPTVVDALCALQNNLEGKTLKLVENNRVLPGLLIFEKNPVGGLERITDPEEQRLAAGQCLVLSNAMEGG
jgi:hypothetical protein